MNIFIKKLTREVMNLGNIRQEFNIHLPLSRQDLAPCPFNQFNLWLEDAIKAKFAEPNGFILSTVNSIGQPSSRTVLLKYFDKQGFVFYTNYQSKKAKEILENPLVSALFPWFSCQRQVKIEGKVEKVSREQTLKYFLSRPRGSQIGAWVSPQSQVIHSKVLLQQQWEKMKEKFTSGEIPLPDFWGGYRIIPTAIEFWQGQPNRLHDRFLYRYQNNIWNIDRLAP